MKNILKKLTNTFIIGSLFLITACQLGINSQQKNKVGKVSFYVDRLTAERTIFPTNTESNFNVEDLSNIILTWQKTGTSDTRRFDTLSDLAACTLELEPGTWTFGLRGSINSIAFEGSTDAVVAENENTEVDFVLNSDSEALKSKISLRFSFETAKNVQMVSSYTNRYYYSGSSISSSSSTLNNLLPLADEEHPETSYFIFEQELPSNSATLEYIFKFRDGDGNIAICRESAMLEPGKTTYGEYVLNNFIKGYKINYFFNVDDEEPGYVDYYTTSEGYSLYGSNTYTWYEDKEGTTLASSKGVGLAAGDIDLYLISEKTYHNITLMDFDGNVVFTSLLEDSKYFEFYANDRIYLQNVSTTYLTKTGFYIANYYKDINKSDYYYTWSSYYPEEDTVIYVDYKPEYKMTFVSLNSGDVIDEFVLRDYYYLESDNYETRNYSINISGYTIKAAYKNAAKTQRVNLNNTYYVTSDTILYVDDNVLPVCYITFIDQNENILFTKVIERYFVLYDTSYYIDDINYNYESGYFAENYYSDYARTSVVNKSTNIYTNSEDVTVYVDLFPITRAVVTNVSYNKAYKLPVQGTNSRLVPYSNARVGKNEDYAWVISTSSSYSNTDTSRTWQPSIYYTSIDSNQDASYSGEWEEVTVENETAYVADTQKARTDISKYIVTDSPDMIVAYKFELETEKTYNVEVIHRDNYSSYLPGSTYCSFYLIDETTGKYCGSWSYNTNISVPSTGVYTLYILGNTQMAGIKCGIHIWEVNYVDAEFNVTVSNDSDISITKTETTDSVVLTAPEGCVKYQWQIGNKIIGNESTLELPKTEISSLGTVVITLRAKTLNGRWYTTTIFVE